MIMVKRFIEAVIDAAVIAGMFIVGTLQRIRDRWSR